MHNQAAIDKRAPMPSAPMRYDETGQVDWGSMWDSFCLLASDGGPPHRETLLEPDKVADGQSETYQSAQDEIIRGVRMVSQLTAVPDNPGWIRVTADSPEMAQWVCDAINEENVSCRVLDNFFFVPVSGTFTVKGEIKNVITAVAKTTHYWQEHLANEVKTALRLQRFIKKVWPWG